MQTGYFLLFLVFPIFLEGCCVRNNQKKGIATVKSIGLQKDTTRLYYRAVKGEIFRLPCMKYVTGHMKMVWSRTGDSREGHDGPSFECDKDFSAEAKHTGTYSDLTGNFFYLQVVEKSSLGCFHPEESWKMLLNARGGEIPCPGRTCSNNTHVTWYKGSRAVSEQRRASCDKNGLLHLCQVMDSDAGVYFCDRQIIEQGVTWTFRRAVTITVIPHYNATYHPRIVYPDANMTEEVELDQSHTLNCEVYFPFEIKISAEVRWYMNYGGNMENMTLLSMEKPQQSSMIMAEFALTQRAIIKKVTPQHLNHTYSCIASNIVGNSKVTIRLKRRIKVKWPSLVGYPIVSLVLVAGLGIILHVKWLELQLIYRSHFQNGKHDGDEKEFDALLSYVWSPPQSAEEDGAVTPCSCSGPDIDEEAYANDVVLAIQRSRMLICVLSADYLCNSNAVFVLESGIQALLQKCDLKLLLIWTSKASASLIESDPSLPTLVQRALKVLPSLDWTSDKPVRASYNFWRSLRKAMSSYCHE
uniref:Interleukin-18 receptor accessory protein-like n=1 Tax=Mastacembelus armatus TaxID=205130 RepID=A0A7N8YB07_9TELE